MTALSAERLAEIRGRQDSRRRQAEVANVHAITLGPSHLWSAMQDGDDLLDEVDRLRDGVDELRGLVRLGARTNAEPEAVRVLSVIHDDLVDLLNPTEGETDE